jgi:AcrR family transcriptional regulator
VAQIKKIEIKQAILDAAYELFSKHGYSDTNITDIARSAGVAPANVYVYFRSKLAILFSIYEPWLIKQFDDLEKSLLRIREPRLRLRKILATVWRNIPSADNGFANNMMQAISTTTTREGYSPALRLAIEERLAKLLDHCLPSLDHMSSRELANILLMAFDGYALNFHLRGGAVCPTKQLTLFADILLGGPQAAARGHTTRAARGQSADRMAPSAAARIA